MPIGQTLEPHRNVSKFCHLQAETSTVRVRLQVQIQIQIVEWIAFQANALIQAIKIIDSSLRGPLIDHKIQSRDLIYYIKKYVKN